MLTKRIKFRFSNKSTANLNDVQNFNKIKDWWTVGGSMQALWQYNYLRVKFMHQVMGIQQQQLSLINNEVLDIGVGGGILSESLCRLGAKVIGIDVSSNSIQTAQNHANQDPYLRDNKNLQYLLTPPELLDIQNNSFDIITAMEVIEHVTNKNAFIDSISSLLKPNGILFLSTMSKTTESFLKLIIGAEYITGIVPQGTHDWNQFINIQDLEQILQKSNLKIIESRGVSYDIITGQMQFSQNTAQYIIAAKKIISN